jgi:formamidopyrimidine-DNA glycosylase
MPELPEVETVRLGMEPALIGRRLRRVLVRRSDLRVPVPENFSKALKGQRIVSTQRRGKYILGFTGGDEAFVLHLGMSGRILIVPPGQRYAFAKHDHVVFETEDGSKVIFNDPRRFGMMYLASRKSWSTLKPFNAMGPEPLADDFTGRVLADALRGRASPIKTTLLDQNVVAGVGNIYACEALFESQIDPRRPAGTVQGREAARLAASIRDVLQRAIAAGGSSLKDYALTDGSRGYFQTAFSVYDREGQSCPGCVCQKKRGAKGIRRIIQGGRSTFYCADKQA